jgi:hypothetical protein
MLLQPTEGHIYFAEFDVMKSVAASLEVAYSNRFRAANTRRKSSGGTTVECPYLSSPGMQWTPTGTTLSCVPA